MNHIERIRSLREDHDMSQAEVASILGIAQTSYSQYETGRVRFPLEHAITLARLYDVDMNFICGVSDQKCPFPKDE